MNVQARIQQLLEEGKTGKQIAQVLLAEEVSISAAREAFYNLGYVVAIYPFTRDIQELYVSDTPMEAGIVAALLGLEPRTMPSVVWKKEE